MPGVMAAARAELESQLNGYPGLPEHRNVEFVAAARLGGMAGPNGTLILAEQAASVASGTAAANVAATARFP
jgi:hypothetical protein